MLPPRAYAVFRYPMHEQNKWGSYCVDKDGLITKSTYVERAGEVCTVELNTRNMEEAATRAAVVSYAMKGIWYKGVRG